MKEVIDLYVKLVIGTFTFLGPSFTLLISLFYRQLDRATNKHKEQLQTLIELDVTNKLLKKQINKNERDINLLNPKRQVKRLFVTLISSILLISFYYFQNSHLWVWKLEWIRVITVVASVMLFSYCLFALWQVFCIIVTAKMDEESEKKGVILQVQK